MSNDLHSLISAVCDNRASQTELSHLAQILSENSVSRDEYLRYIDLHAALADEALPVVESGIVDYRSPATTFGFFHQTEKPSVGIHRDKKFLLVASVLVFAIVGLFWQMLHESKNVKVEQAGSIANETPLATILFSEDCRWLREDIVEGQRLNPGRIDLQSGTAVLRFDGGAELVLVGPAAINLQTSSRVLVHHGDIIVRAANGAEGFVVTTPTSEVIDLGTEFAVKVDCNGATEVHVLDGEVSYRGLYAAEELTNILRTGEGIAIDGKGLPRSVPMNSPRFQEFVNRVNPRSRSDLLMAYEGFNYSPGLLQLNESTLGKGWAGPWRKRLPQECAIPSEDSSPDYFEIAHGEMNVTWPVPGGRLGSLMLPGGGVYYIRPMKQGIDLEAEDVTFFSLMVRETKRRSDSERPRERLRLTLRSSDDFHGPCISFGHGSGYRPFVQVGDGVVFTCPLVLPAEQTTLWIGKIVSRQYSEDEIYFRVYCENDVLDYAEPATWHVVTRNVVLHTELDLVLLSSEGKTARLVDELRIGPTWRSVAPMVETKEEISIE